jgi:hypothetical protein
MSRHLRPEASSQPGDVTAILTPDSDASMSASPPLVDTSTSTLEAPGPGGKVASEGKRKQEDDSDTTLAASMTRKKLKLEVPDVEQLLLSEAVSDAAAAVDNPANVCDALRPRHKC